MFGRRGWRSVASALASHPTRADIPKRGAGGVRMPVPLGPIQRLLS